MTKRILYIHGLGGGANGRVASIMREELPSEEYTVEAPEIPINPKEAVDYLKKITADDKCDLIVASSLGAFYAMSTWSHTKKILINPAIYADEYIDKFIGKGIQQFRGLRKDKKTEYIIDDDFINSLKEIRERQICSIDDEDKIMYRCYVSTEDEVLIDNYKNCEDFFYKSTLHFIKGPHSVDENELRNIVIPDIIKDL